MDVTVYLLETQQYYAQALRAKLSLIEPHCNLKVVNVGWNWEVARDHDSLRAYVDALIASTGVPFTYSRKKRNNFSLKYDGTTHNMRRSRNCFFPAISVDFAMMAVPVALFGFLERTFGLSARDLGKGSMRGIDFADEDQERDALVVLFAAHRTRRQEETIELPITPSDVGQAVSSARDLRMRVRESHERLVWFKSRQRTRLAVFVHGLGGSVTRSWARLPILLDRDDSLSGIDFAFWGYPTRRAGFRGEEGRWWRLLLNVVLKSGVPKVEHIGRTLATDVGAIFRDYSEILLFGHSMGGLVVEEAVANVAEAGTLKDLHRLRNVALCCTPTAGSEIAEIVKSVGSVQVNDLAVDSPYRSQLQRRFLDTISGRKRPGFPIPLTVWTALNDQIVSDQEVLSTFDKTIAEVGGIRGNHSDCIKVRGKSDPNYKVFSQWLRD